MENIKSTVKNGKLYLEIDLTHRGAKSTSGKSTIVATTGGNQPVEGYPDIKMGVNLYVK